MNQELNTDDIEIQAEGVVTHGPGTHVITITVFDGKTPTDEHGLPIPLDTFADWLKDMSDQWVVESRVF